jgi:hypothetical protein
LTSSENKALGYPAYVDGDKKYGTSDDQGPLIKNIVDHNIRVFVGLGRDMTSDLKTYLQNPLTTDQAEFAKYQSQGLYKYENKLFETLSHPDMATNPIVRTAVLDFLLK